MEELLIWKVSILMKEFLKKYKHAWILGYVFIYLAWFLYLERTVTDHYHVIRVPLDDYIPFNEYFIIPYLLWFGYVAATVLYFFFRDKEGYYRLCTMLFSGMTISLIICTFFPNGTDFRPLIDADKNLCSRLVARLYEVDTCTNVFPSIHVYNSICTHLAIAHSAQLRQYKLLRSASFVLMIAICLATVCLKQHSIMDVLGGTLMAYVIYYAVYGTNELLAEKEQRAKALS